MTSDFFKRFLSETAVQKADAAYRTQKFPLDGREVLHCRGFGQLQQRYGLGHINRKQLLSCRCIWLIKTVLSVQRKTKAK